MNKIYQKKRYTFFLDEASMYHNGHSFKTDGKMERGDTSDNQTERKKFFKKNSLCIHVNLLTGLYFTFVTDLC